MTQTIFERKKSKTTFANGVKVKVPEDRSVLSMLGNKFGHGEEFRQDGYVYSKKKRLRKWFAMREGWKHFWAPLENQLVRVEATYFKLVKRQEKLYSTLDKHIRAIMRRTRSKDRYGQPAYVVHSHGEHGWFAYYIYEREESSWAYSYDRLDKKPAKIMNRKLGDEMHRLADRTMNQSWRHRVGALLHDIIIKRMLNEKHEKKPRTEALVKFVVNGRFYLYTWQYNRYGALWPEKVLWPLDNVIEVNVHE